LIRTIKKFYLTQRGSSATGRWSLNTQNVMPERSVFVCLEALSYQTF
jgi:hypothetical protein